MNDKQNDKQRYPGSEERIAEQTVRMLEARTNKASSKDDQATTELGQLLRDAAQANLPESNVDLREQLIAQLDGGSPASEQVTVASKEMTSREVASGKLALQSTGHRRFGLLLRPAVCCWLVARLLTTRILWEPLATSRCWRIRVRWVLSLKSNLQALQL